MEAENVDQLTWLASPVVGTVSMVPHPFASRDAFNLPVVGPENRLIRSGEDSRMGILGPDLYARLCRRSEWENPWIYIG